MNIKQIKADANIVEVVGRHVALKPKGPEMVGLCPFHDDHKSSLNVNFKKQLFYCPACGAKGDVFDFLVMYGRTIKEAANEIQGVSAAAASGNIQKRDAKPSKFVAWTLTTGAPIPSQIVHYKHGKPSASWQYFDAERNLMGLICRFDIKDGKEVIPYTYCTDGTRKEYRWQGFPNPRPLYGLADLAARPDATVLVVEGEKTADAAQSLLSHIVVVTWPGGAEATRRADFAPLYGRKVVFWPDNDKEHAYGPTSPLAGQIKPWNEQPGNAAMLDIAEQLKDHCTVLKWIYNAPEFPNKWDIADAYDWREADAIEYVRANIGAMPTEPWPIIEQYTPEIIEQSPEPEQETKPAIREQVDLHESYFRFLGYEKDGDSESLVFYIKEAKMVHKYSARGLGSVTTLINLAPLDFWQHMFPKKSGNRVDGEAAANWLVRSGRSTGVFSSSRLRGRGAWIDGGRVVIHAGEKLIVDGTSVALGNLKTKYIYEAGEDLDIGQGKPLATPEANKLLEICKLCNWERPISAHLLAGWCVIAPICGALDWRSHVWITGPAGTGKTWIVQNIVRRMLGRTCVMVQGETSEAGVRQTLGVDALPVLFDEAEGQNHRAADRIQSILGLVRAASAEDGGYIVKGSATGGVKQYRIRSCFAFSSIALGLQQQSDRSRVTVLSVMKNNDEESRTEKWTALQKLHRETVTDEYCDALQARTISIVPIILENAKTFAAAAASVLGDQRTGDQLGPLLAGAYSLSSTGKITFEAARKWIEERDWTEERALDDSRDERRLLGYILDYITRIEGDHNTVERSIGELVQVAALKQDDAHVSADMANARLKRLGMKVERGWFFVSNNSAQVTKMLKDTSWSVNHNRILERINGSMKTRPERFSGSVASSRSVAIPIDCLSIMND